MGKDKVFRCEYCNHEYNSRAERRNCESQHVCNKDFPDEITASNFRGVSVFLLGVVASYFIIGGTIIKCKDYLHKRKLHQQSKPAIIQPAGTNLSYNSSFVPVRVADCGLDKNISEI